MPRRVSLQRKDSKFFGDTEEDGMKKDRLLPDKIELEICGSN